MNSFTQYQANERTRSGHVKWILGRKVVGLAAGVLGMLFLVPGAAGSHKDHPYRYSVVDEPVSLGVGTVRTPAFPVASQWYDIMVQVEKPLPFKQMACMMGVASGIFDPKDCSSNDPLLRADWRVLDGDQIVDKGSIPDRCACKFEDKHIYKFLGSFAGEAGKKYIVEVKFTKDGTPLNVANPHLIVIKRKDN